MRLFLTCIIALFFASLVIASGSAAKIGGDVGWYEFHCSADGAEVFLDNTNVGQITNGMLSVPVYTTATPYKMYTVSYTGCGSSYSITKNLPGIPGKGQTIDIYVDIPPDPCPTPTPKVIGGDKGYYMIWSNEDDVSISMDGDNMGVTQNGYLQIPVYTTGTPYKILTAEKPGYATVTEEITDHPAAGETVDMYVTMNPIIIAASGPDTKEETKEES